MCVEAALTKGVRGAVSVVSCTETRGRYNAASGPRSVETHLHARGNAARYACSPGPIPRHNAVRVHHLCRYMAAAFLLLLSLWSGGGRTGLRPSIKRQGAIRRHRDTVPGRGSAPKKERGSPKNQKREHPAWTPTCCS